LLLFRFTANFTISGRSGAFESEDILLEREVREAVSRPSLPPPPAPSAPNVEETQIAIRHRSSSPARRRSTYHETDVEFESNSYNRKSHDRGHHGKTCNSAVRHQDLINISSGPPRPHRDSNGVESQEFHWQSRNGSRRTKFVSVDKEYTSDFGAAGGRRRSLPPPESKKKDMWTEVTKDLVIRDAVETMGYQYEETEEYFYIMEYLRYVSFPWIILNRYWRIWRF